MLNSSKKSSKASNKKENIDLSTEYQVKNISDEELNFVHDKMQNEAIQGSVVLGENLSQGKDDLSKAGKKKKGKDDGIDYKRFLATCNDYINTVNSQASYEELKQKATNVSQAGRQYEDSHKLAFTKLGIARKRIIKKMSEQVLSDFLRKSKEVDKVGWYQSQSYGSTIIENDNEDFLKWKGYLDEFSKIKEQGTE